MWQACCNLCVRGSGHEDSRNLTMRIILLGAGTGDSADQTQAVEEVC